MRELQLALVKVKTVPLPGLKVRRNKHILLISQLHPEGLDELSLLKLLHGVHGLHRQHGEEGTSNIHLAQVESLAANACQAQRLLQWLGLQRGVVLHLLFEPLVVL